MPDCPTPRRMRRGNYSMLMGAIVMVILGFSALAVDISLITMAELQAQSTADAASHAALVAYRNDTSANPDVAGTTAAQFMLQRNQVALGAPVLESIEFGAYDRSADTFCSGCGALEVNAVKVELSRTGGNAVDLLLAPMFGISTHDVRADSVTAHQKRAIMLIQDSSCSMNAAFPAAIDLSRKANLLFLDYMVNFNQAGDMLGLAAYAEYGAIEYHFDVDAGAEVLGWDGSTTTGSGLARATNGNEPPWARLSLVATEEGYLRQQFAGICNSEAGCPDDASTGTTTSTEGIRASDVGTCTNPSIAMRQAIEQFRLYTDPLYFRGMVVMSDGRFNCRGGDAAAQQAANEAYNNYDIHIWTVLYHNGSFDESEMRNLTRGYGFFQMSPDPADLPAMYATIAAALPTSIVD